MPGRFKTHEEHLQQRFQTNPEEAVAYLNAALKERDRRVFLLALRDVAKALGGIAKLSRKTKIAREHLYTVLSDEGNPEFFKLCAVLAALDLHIEIKAKNKRRTRRKVAA